MMKILFMIAVAWWFTWMWRAYRCPYCQTRLMCGDFKYKEDKICIGCFKRFKEDPEKVGDLQGKVEE